MSNSRGVSAPLPFPGQPGESGDKDRHKTRKKVFHNAIPHIKKVYKTLRRTGIFAAGSTGKYRPPAMSVQNYQQFPLKENAGLTQSK